MAKRDVFQKMIDDLDIEFLFSGMPGFGYGKKMSESTYRKRRKRIIRKAAEAKKKRK